MHLQHHVSAPHFPPLNTLPSLHDAPSIGLRKSFLLIPATYKDNVEFKNSGKDGKKGWQAFQSFHTRGKLLERRPS